MASVKKRAKTALQICGKANDKIYRDSLVKTAKALMKLDNVEIISHRAPDGDTLGCSSALCRGLRFLGKKANVVCADAIPDKYAFLFDGIEPQALEAQHFVTVDIAAPHLMGKLKETYENKIDVCIDHHIDNSISAPVKMVDQHAAATAEIIWQLLSAMGVVIDQSIANDLFAALSTDTGCFKYSNVTEQTHLIAIELMKCGAECAKINYKLIDEETKAKMELKKQSLATLEYFCDNRCAVITITKAMMEASGALPEDTDGISNIPRSISGVDCGITMRETDDGWKISVRSDEKLNAATLCGRFGGGGHAAAAGCKFNASYEDAKTQLVEAAKELMQ